MARHYRKVLSRFAGGEGGSLTVLSLFLMICVMFVVGIAVDVVRFEAHRTRVQNTLDRAILAAADMGQTLSAEEVVSSYFEKAGLGDYYTTPIVTSGFNSKTVSATATGMMDTFFMNLLGIHELQTVSAGEAEESISDIEISLVLDISGSMNEAIYEEVSGTCRDRRGRYYSCTYQRNTGSTKIEALRAAGQEFVDTIYGSTEDARTSMSIIPFNQQVNAGPDLLAWYNLTSQNGIHFCVDFNNADFSSPSISTVSQVYRSDVFDRSGRNNPIDDTGDCPTASYSSILPLAGDPAILKAKIAGLQGGGNTSLEIGTKWGTALLDPSARPAITGMIGTLVGGVPQVPADFAGRPFDYTNTDTMKVMVAMTDGQNTSEYRLDSDYRGQLSGVWLWMDGTTPRYSVHEPEGSGVSYDGDGAKNETYRWLSKTSGTDRWNNAPQGGAAAQELTFNQLWERMSFDWHAYYIRRAVWGGINSSKASAAYSAWDSGLYDSITGSTKDSNLLDICQAAKDQGIIVFSIGFEVTDYSAGLLRDCASSPSHFYRVQGLEITTAFQSIANAIGKLRLTQ